MDDVLHHLAALLPPGVLTTDPDIVAAHAHDESQLTPRETPSGLLTPRSTSDVAACLRAASSLGLPVVTRGAGSGLSGAANAPAGSLVLSTRAMTSVIEIDPVERIAVVQAGVVTADLRSAVAARGLFYPPDPGSVEFCTVGGNVATNAGGMCCVKYGVTKDYVLGLEIVLADGRVMRTGRRTVKGVAGYDLTSLLVGSEGTLGVVTEVTVRLLPAPPPASTLVATFASLDDAGRAVAGIVARGLDVSMLEIMDRTTVAAVDALTGMGVGADVMLLVQSDRPDPLALLEQVQQVCGLSGAVDVVLTDDPAEGRMLLEARRQALPALERLGDWLLDDVCVPRSRIVDLIAHVQVVAADSGLTIGVFGHAGDGNMHPTIIFDGTDPDSVVAAHDAFDRITSFVLEVGGTITGEHGVGRLKRDWLQHEIDGTSLAVHRAIKDALDPLGILNPGSVV